MQPPTWQTPWKQPTSALVVGQSLLAVHVCAH
jgi:hypothetical protein